METPPNTNTTRPNFMQFRRGEPQEQFLKSQMMSKFGPKYHLYKKDMVPVLAQRQNINKIMADMKKQINYLDSTKWMFENNDQSPLDNYNMNPL